MKQLFYILTLSFLIISCKDAKPETTIEKDDNAR
jgi:hypothetical protein